MKNQKWNSSLSDICPVETIKTVSSVDALLQISGPSLIVLRVVSKILENAIFDYLYQLVQLAVIIVRSFVMEVELELLNPVVGKLFEQGCYFLA